MFGNGAGVFPVPTLRLAPGEQVIAAQQLSANFRTCTTVVEIGTPVNVSGDADVKHGGSTETMTTQLQENAGPTSALSPLALQTSTGYYRVYWHDPIHAEVHELKTTLSWSYAGTCVRSGSGTAIGGG